jgi:hypothetical protein
MTTTEFLKELATFKDTVVDIKLYFESTGKTIPEYIKFDFQSMLGRLDMYLLIKHNVSSILAYIDDANDTYIGYVYAMADLTDDGLHFESKCRLGANVFNRTCVLIPKVKLTNELILDMRMQAMIKVLDVIENPF